MTTEQILAELARYFGPIATEGLTAREIASALKVSKHKVIDVLRTLIASGEWEIVKVQRQRMDGVTQWCPAYRPKIR